MVFLAKSSNVVAKSPRLVHFRKIWDTGLTASFAIGGRLNNDSEGTLCKTTGFPDSLVHREVFLD